MIRVHVKISALFVVSHFLSADEVSPEIMEVKYTQVSGPRKSVPFYRSNRGVPSTEVTDTKII